VRAFLAIELPAPVCARVTARQRQLQQQLADQHLGECVRWTASASLHLTLRFLGECPPAQVNALLAALPAVAAGFAPLTLSLGALGCFPNFRRPGIVWLDCGGEVEALLHLQTACEQLVRTAGFAAEEHPFTPHLTIGRMQRSAAPAALQRAGDLLRRAAQATPATTLPSFTVTEICLMESDLHPTGAVYTPLGCARVGSLT
jgi:2'-5' RNA ligase